MTVVVGFVGSDGGVMASDSEATDSGGATRYDVDKIWTCGGLLLGYTGNTAVMQPVAAKLKGEIPKVFGEAEEIERWEGQSALQNAVGPVLKHCYTNHVGPMNEKGIPNALDGILLVLGRDANGYWLMELDGLNAPTFLTDNGFHAVGSGSPAAYVAQSLMKDYDSAGRSVAHLKLIAHRTVQTCIDTIGGRLGVGGEVKLWYSHDNSPFVQAKQEEIESINSGIEQWRTLERESLAKVVIPGHAPVEDTGVPLPDALDDTEDSEAVGDETDVVSDPPHAPDAKPAA